MEARREILILNRAYMHDSLRIALEQRGISFREGNWTFAQTEDLQNYLAVFECMYNILRHPVRTWFLKQRLQRYRIPLFVWNRDAPHYLNRSKWRLNWLDRARLLDIYATHSLLDKRSFANDVLYFPNAANTNTYHPSGDIEVLFRRLRDPQVYLYDVTFFGGMNGLRYKEDAARQAFFTVLGKRLADLNIRFLFCEAEGMSVDEQIKLIHSSRINLNFGARCEYQAPIASGLPERCFGIPACGGFLLCDKRTHAQDDFTIGENWAEFIDIDDCITQIKYWLSHFDQARDLAERCYHHVMSNHTYRNRAEKLHEALLSWHKLRETTTT
jgi:spore maturation protein CgeB